jgi:hypothetical protein
MLDDFLLKLLRKGFQLGIFEGIVVYDGFKDVTFGVCIGMAV